MIPPLFLIILTCHPFINLNPQAFLSLSNLLFNKVLKLHHQVFIYRNVPLAIVKLLMHESKKLIFRSPITLFFPYYLSHILTYKALQILLHPQVFSLQVALIGDTILTFQSCPCLNISNWLKLLVEYLNWLSSPLFLPSYTCPGQLLHMGILCPRDLYL